MDNKFIDEAIKIERQKWIGYINIILEKDMSKESIKKCLKNLIEMEKE